MKVADAIVKGLKEENVTTVFGYPGAAIMPLYEALRPADIHHVLVRQEQAAGHSASGYARVTGKVGVCVVTSGPGATNIVTGIATAYMDSIPLVIMTGQVKSHLIGKDVFQEIDITGATEPFVKHSYLVKDASQIPRIIKEAFYIARTGRPGPVLIDLPSDILEEQIDYNPPKEVDIRGYKPTHEGHMGQIKRAMKALEQSERPLVCIGGGIQLAQAHKQLKEFIDITNIPLVHTLMGTGNMPSQSPHNMGMIGSHGFKHSNNAVQKADAILFIGARIADRSMGEYVFDEEVQIIHIDVDPAEISKNAYATIPVVGNAKHILKQMIELAKPLSTEKWIHEIESIKEEQVEQHIYDQGVNPKLLVRELSKLLPDDTIVTADVGQNQMWVSRHMEMKGSRQFLTSGGLGTMGYSLPCGIGACMAAKDRKVVSVMGDGGFQMSFSELGTLVQEEINPLIIVFNNSKLGMVHEMQYKNYNKEYGVDLKGNPNFAMIAKAYGIQTARIEKPEDIQRVLENAVNHKGPFLIECIVDPKESTL